jgi:membrane-associated phospholipid phosphatase
MDIKSIFLCLTILLSAQVRAANWYDMEPLKLEVPSAEAQPNMKMDLDFFKSKTNQGVKERKFLDDMTFVGLPVFVAGMIIKGEKRGFQSSDRYANTRTKLVTNFKTRIDDYTQFFGPVMTVGLKAAGVEGRSDWPRLITSSALSYAWMAAFVNGIKYTAKEMRPDGSTANSWPSGHTATSFVGATILHKEYGLTRSPWYSIAGYGVATATGVMRILNNRHWISDVLSGAGIGILSTELGYAFGDLIFKKKGLLRNDLDSFSENPSFFSIGMGLGWGLKGLDFGVSDLTYQEDASDFENGTAFGVDFHTASVVDAEGAYFFNKYIGVGGRLRVRAMTAKSWSDFVGLAQKDRVRISGEILDVIDNYSVIPTSDIKKELATVCTSEEYSVESDHLTEFSASVGLYFNIPLGKRFALGSKLLIGRTMTQELDINAHYKGDVKNAAYLLTMTDGLSPSSGFKVVIPVDGVDTTVPIEDGAMLFVDKFQSTGKSYDQEWDYLTMGGNNSTNYGTGLSLTYKYKSNFSWRVYVDYDYSQKEFTLTYDPYRFMKLATPNLEAIYQVAGTDLEPYQFKKKKNLHYFTVGGSFMVTF